MDGQLIKLLPLELAKMRRDFCHLLPQIMEHFCNLFAIKNHTKYKNLLLSTLALKWWSTRHRILNVELFNPFRLA